MSIALRCAAAVPLLVGCRSVFNCADDASCRLDGAQGRCEPEGYCSFPDGSCSSGFAYGEFAPREIAGACVPEEPVGTSSTGVATAPTADAESGLPPPPQTDASTTDTDEGGGPDPFRPPPDVGAEPPPACLPPAECTIYVDPEGNDDNFGDEGSPVATIQRGVNLALAGDVICVGPGEYFEEVDIGKSGGPGEPIVLRAATPGSVVLRDRITLFIDWGVAVEHVTIEGLEIDGGGEHCMFVHSASDVVLRGNDFHDCVSSCIAGTTYRLVLDGNTFRGCDDGAGGGHGALISGSEGVAINNVFADNVQYGFYLTGTWDPKHPNAPAAEYFVNSRDWLFSNNVFVGNQRRAGMLVSSAATTGSLIQNNIFMNNAAAGTALGPNGIAFTGGGDHVLRNNLYFGDAPGEPVTDAAAVPSYVETEPLLTDPRFFDAEAGDYRLQPSSPAIDSGTLESAPEHDIACAPRPAGSGVDRGVFEMQDE